MRCGGVRVSVDKIISCTGPAGSIFSWQSPLIRQTLADGIVALDVIGLWLKVDADFKVASLGCGSIYAIGRILRDSLWVTTAVHDIREEAFKIAEELMASTATSQQLAC